MLKLGPLFFNGEWCDVAVLNGTPAIGYLQRPGRFIVEHDGRQAVATSIPAWGLYLRIAANSRLSKPFAGVWQDGREVRDGGGVIWASNGTDFRQLASSPAQNGALIAPTATGWRVVVETDGGAFLDYDLDEALQDRQPPTRRQMQLGSQGFLGFDRGGNPIPTDIGRGVRVNGEVVAVLPGWAYDAAGNVTFFGQHPQDFALRIVQGNTVSTVLRAEAYEPHIVAVPDGRFAVCARTPQGALYAELVPPFAADAAPVPTPVPAPTPTPVPTPAPTPKTMKLPDSVKATRDRYIARFPIPQGPMGDAFEDQARQWTIKLAQQVQFEHPNEGWGVKSADPGRPISKDTIARLVDGRLYIWDLLTGTGTGRPTLVEDPNSEDVTGQFLHTEIGPADYLGVPTPTPVPVPTPVPQPPTTPPPDAAGPTIVGLLTRIATATEAQVAELKKLEAAVSQLPLLLPATGNTAPSTNNIVDQVVAELIRRVGKAA